jgi:DNA polymerase-3 subunit alpha
VVSYHTAYLKTHHRAEFMAALLTSQIGDTESVIKYINEARELGIEILPPDVNESGYKFTVITDEQVRFGLGAIRNVGLGAIDSILAARFEKPFTSIFDLCERVDLRLCNKRVFEALIAAGALDSLGGHRRSASPCSTPRSTRRRSSRTRSRADRGRSSAAATRWGTSGRSSSSSSPTWRRWPTPSASRGEKEILGFYISGHPLEPFRTECELFATHDVSDLGAWTPEPMALGVVVTAIKRQMSKRSGAEFARLTVEDFSGSSEVLVFPEAWSVLADRVRTDVPILLKGGYSKRDQDAETPTFIVEKVTPVRGAAHERQRGRLARAGAGRRRAGGRDGRRAPGGRGAPGHGAARAAVAGRRGGQRPLPLAHRAPRRDERGARRAARPAGRRPGAARPRRVAAEPGRARRGHRM